MSFDLATAREMAGQLRPGDHLLYGPGRSLVNRIICVKTWSPVSHIEIHVGNGRSVASRNGIGVGDYPIRLGDLAFILRPLAPGLAQGVPRAQAWFMRDANGQRYDWLGLMVFFLAVHRGSKDRMFCSEFATRWDRHAGIRAIAPHWDADAVAPGDFLQSPAFDVVWHAAKYTLSAH